MLELTNFILYNTEHAQTLLPVWFAEVINLPQNKKLLMFKSMTEILLQTYGKTDIFIRDFAQNLHINFPIIIQNITDSNVFKKLEDIIVSWEENDIYRHDFKEYLIRCLNTQRFYGNSGIPNDDIAPNQIPVYLNEDKVRDDLRVITRNKIASELFALQFQEINIQAFNNENVNSHQLDQYLKSHPKMNEEVSIVVNQCEKICKDFKRYLMRDLVRRERVINALANKTDIMKEEYMEEENKQ